MLYEIEHIDLTALFTYCTMSYRNDTDAEIGSISASMSYDVV